MRYLILGSEGQIGKHLVQYVRRQGHEAIEYDIRRDRHQDLRLFGHERDRKRHILEKSVANCDFIFFLAWDVGGSKYLSGAESSFGFIHNNTAIMNETFFMLKKYKKPFIFTSSQMAAMAHSPYGNTKLVGERFTRTLNGIFVRLWNVYGYEKKVDERSHVITDFVNMALNDSIIKMRTDGAETRQFLYVEDCCEALFVLSNLYDEMPRCNEFHVSSYEWTSIEKIAEIVSTLCSCKYIKGISKDDVQMAIQHDPNKNILEYWKPKISIVEGISCIIKKMKG